MDRRRLLMACLNTGSWEQYSQQYLYYTLIPQTINSKPVKNKAKVSKIYGNGEIVNQLVENGNFESTNNWNSHGTSSMTVANNVITLTYDGSYGNCRLISSNIGFLPNHNYLVSVKIKPSKNCPIGAYAFYGQTIKSNTNITANIWNDYTFLFTANSSATSQTVAIGIQLGTIIGDYFSTGDTLQYKEFIICDLTLMFGTGNEPTTLTDNRIQNILNRGYIPYNLGEYKGTDIGEFKSEPYNLFVGTITETNHYLNVSGGTTSDSDCDVSDYYYIKGGVSITLEGANPRHWSNPSICWYDENKNFIGGQKYNGQETIVLTLPTNVCYVRFTTDKTNADICLHRTGTRTGYETHKTFTPISFKYQGNGAINSHDTMEIGKENVVFTKNNAILDLGSLDYGNSGSTGNSACLSSITNIKSTATNNDLPDMLSTWGARMSYNASWVGNVVSLTSAGILWVKLPNNPSESGANIKQLLKGYTLTYPLATPQVITIPRKHLGIVRISDISGWAVGSNGRCRSGEYFKNIIKYWSGYGTVVNTIYCSAFINDSPLNMESSSPTNLSISISGNGYTVEFYDNSCSTTQQYLDKYGDYYIFYYTENEVADITDTIDIESGGTITTDSEVLPNVDLSVKCK